MERVAAATNAQSRPDGRASPTLGGMRVVIADPPAYTPPYDHALAAALVTKGVDVRLLTSRFRYGAVPRASGYAFDDSLYRLSSRIGSRHGRLVAKALEHPLALARLGLADCDLLHLQWVSAPEADNWLLHARAPLVFTAHDPCRDERYGTRAPGDGSSLASTGSSSTASAAVAHSRSSVSPTRSCASFAIRPSMVKRSERATAAPCSRSA